MNGFNNEKLYVVDVDQQHETPPRNHGLVGDEITYMGPCWGVSYEPGMGL
jgi:hypothetical protein